MNQTLSCLVACADFACCALGHRKTFPDGKTTDIPCDKLRLKGLCASMWQRKSSHFQTASDFVKHVFSWRYISHMKMMMAETTVDDASTEDECLVTVDDIFDKYYMREPGFKPQMRAFAQFSVGLMRDNRATWFAFMSDHEHAAAVAELSARAARLVDALGRDDDAGLVSHALALAVAEGHLPLVRLLVEGRGADPSLGMGWGMVTLVDYAAGKGHVRVLRYLLERCPAAARELNRPSSMRGITAVDRAAKCGALDALEVLVEFGADVAGVARFNGQTPAHGAAMGGHLEVLRALRRLGVDLLATDKAGKTAADYARFYFQTETVAYLAGLEEEASLRG